MRGRSEAEEGRSYLMGPDLDAERARAIADDILPLVEEYFFEQPEEVAAIRRMLRDEEGGEGDAPAWRRYERELARQVVGLLYAGIENSRP
jgi:hypothetical protein